MLVPKRVKHRKVQRGSMKGKAKGYTTLNHGEWGIQALEAHWITNRQIEAARVAMTREMKRGGKVWITIFPDKPITQKPAETRMGSGKGNPESWVAVVKPGRIMFEIGGVDEATAKEACRLAINKLPIKCKIVQRPAEEVAAAQVAEDAKKAAKAEAAAESAEVEEATEAVAAEVEEAPAEEAVAEQATEAEAAPEAEADAEADAEAGEE